MKGIFNFTQISGLDRLLLIYKDRPPFAVETTSMTRVNPGASSNLSIKLFVHAE